MRNVKNEFPIFEANPDLVYLDSAATAQKPKRVIEAIAKYYSEYNANVHRGIYEISEKATEGYEKGRERVARFIGAALPSEIIFTKNATESINLLRYTWAERNLSRGDTVLVTVLEHHSNFVPWLDLRDKKGVNLKVVDLKDGLMTGEQIAEQIDESVKLVAASALSNALGIEIDLTPVIAKAREVGAKILIDACQLVVHKQLDVKNLDCDFLVFSGHKLYGPIGIGVLYAKHGLLDDEKPFLFGGDMIKYVEVDGAEFMPVPQRYEAGTQNVAGVIGLAEAMDFMDEIGMPKIEAHDRKLCEYAEKKLNELDYVRIIGSGSKLSAVSFVVDGVHAHDVAQILADRGVAVRSGYHCAQPVMDLLDIPGTVRMSFGVYNDEKDIDTAVEALKEVKKIFG